MKKILLLLILTFFSTNSYAEKLHVIMAGSAGGTNNAFNKELIKDLSEFYDIISVPGQSMVKGGQIYTNTNKDSVFVMTQSSSLNAIHQTLGEEPVLEPTSESSFMFAITYFKTMCVKKGNNLEQLFNSGNTLKIGLTDSAKVNEKYIRNLNRITNSKNIMVPYNSSGKQSQGLITGDIDVALLNEAKAKKFTASDQMTCNYTTNKDGGNGYDSLVNKVQDDWFGWQYHGILFGHLKNTTEEFSKEFHITVTKIINDPNSNSYKKLRKNGWFALDLSQTELHQLYNENFDQTLTFLED